jgi:hypothetical protein
MPKVEVPTIIRVASGLAVLVCAFSLIAWLSTGFYLIYPPISALVGAVSLGFFLMGEILRWQWTNR